MKNQPISRRSAFQLAGAAAVATPFAAATAEEKKVSLATDDVILFQGDSITDAGRDKARKVKNDSRALGRGYPFPIASYLLAKYPSLGLQIHNRGISGNKVPDLDKRWQADCLELKPAVLSILIGVNDIWHKLNGRYDGTPEDYRDGFTALLERTREALPDTTFVVCEPFALRCGAVKDNWFPEFDVRKGYAKEVATKAGAIWVPFQEKFDEAIAAGTEPAYWAGDGVHPTHAGHGLMAKTWLETVGL
ncbi:MAG: SGNH/GDSL hydrolase family protein [Verrucomicrobiales bacterium]|nr:SGNH/GDSL hydrolase family protein [Verrucomicrobiales bacterium]